MNPWQVLGVTEDAPQEDVRAAYRRLTRTHHPDRHANSSPNEQALHEQRMAEVTGAWRLINDPAALARHRARRQSTSDPDRKDSATRPGEARPAGTPGTSDETGTARSRGFDYRDAASTEFTVGADSRWDRTPPPRHRPTPSSGPTAQPSAARPRRSAGRRLLTGLFWVVVLTVFGGGAWIAFTDEGQAFYNDLVAGDSGSSRKGVATSDGSVGRARTPGGSAGTTPDDFAPDTSRVDQLAVGTCLDLTVEPDDPSQPDGAGSVVDILPIPCGQPHQSEALAVLRLTGGPGSPWPGSEGVMDEIAPTCDQVFQAAIGRDPIPDDQWTISFLLPSPESWASGDRQAVCNLSTADGSLVTGSAVAGTLVS